MDRVKKSDNSDFEAEKNVNGHLRCRGQCFGFSSIGFERIWKV